MKTSNVLLLVGIVNIPAGSAARAVIFGSDQKNKELAAEAFRWWVIPLPRLLAETKEVPAMKTIKLTLLACALAVLSFTVSPEARAHDEAPDMKNCLPMSQTGNADVDFIRSMIPHHRMALQMAEKELKNGKDAAAKEMAQNIITAQKREISTMETWLKTYR